MGLAYWAQAQLALRSGTRRLRHSVSSMDRSMALDVEAATTICRARFADHTARLGVPSLAWALVHDGDVIDGVDVDAVYRIASMTKSFTAAAILALRDDGILGLDDPVVERAPSVSGLLHPDVDAPGITVRHLLSMSSGLATDDAWADRHLDLADEELDAIVAAGPTFAGVPGTVFEYSNLGYGVLGRVACEVSGMRLQDFVTQRLLEPLGLGHTTWTAPDDAVAGYRSRATSTDPLVVEPFVGDGAIAPMGGLFTTARDLATWIDFLSSSFSSDEVSPVRAPSFEMVLRASSRREMQRVWTALSPEPTVERSWTVRPGGYGFGLRVQPHGALGEVITHSGGLPGFGSNMRWIRSTGVGLVALSNATYAPMAGATSDVLDVLASSAAVRAGSPEPTVDLLACAQRLVALLATWTDDAAAALFTDNVPLDQPFDERAEAARDLVAEYGPLTVARVVALSASSAIIVAHAHFAEVHIEFELAVTRPARIQLYETTVKS
jgi:CubicO group peptidase (beta-lactamase class C family)